MSDEASTLEENMGIWLDNIRQQFPKRHTGVYTIPAIHINRVPYHVLTFADESVYVPQTPCDKVQRKTKRSSRRKAKRSSTRKEEQLPPVHQSDVKTDAAQQRVLFCLTKMADREKQAMMMLSQLQFGDYLGDKAYAAATALLPQSKNLRWFATDDQSSGKNPSRGDFDILIINHHHGLIVCEIKSFGDTHGKDGDFLNILKGKIKQAVEQMTKARLMLRHLVSDLAPDLTIRVSLVLPNVTRQDIMQALCGDSDLKTSLGQCLGSRPLPADLADLCLCSDDLSHCATPWDVTPDVLEKMSRWWHKLVVSPKKYPLIDFHLYDNLLARFCGPATTVTVPCVTKPRMSLKTLPEAVSEAGEIFAQITLHHHQVELLQDMARHLDSLHTLSELNAADASEASSSRRLFVCGPPGTGKSVVLLLAAREWLRRGHDVQVVITWNESRLASYLLEHLLLASLHALAKPGQTLGEVRLHEFDFLKAHKMLKAVQSLVKEAKSGSLFVVCDEAGPDYGRPRFPDFCEKLWARVPGLHLWAASCQHRHCSSYWRCVALTHALRSPPVVVREVAQAEEISDGDVYRYSESNLPSPTDGPPVKFICHEGHAHTGAAPHDCETCGREVGDFLNGLVVVADSRPGSSPTKTSSSDETSNVTSASSNSESETPSTVVTTATTTAAGNASVSAHHTAPGLRFSDVLVLCESRDVGDQSGLLGGLRQRKVPVRPMGREDARDLVKATQDLVWVAHWTNVLGLERKVVVYVGVKDRQTNGTMYDRLHCLSRCTAQLVWVYPSKSGIGPVSGHTRVWGELKVQGQKETESPADSREACSQQRHASHMFTATPVFCPTWYAVHSVTCDGGAFNHGDSDVVLYVPPDAVGRHVTAAVHAGSCANLAQVQPLMGLATGSVYIASPLVELWAGAHFRFLQPVRIRLPHYLPPGHDPTKVYVICLERSKVGQPHLFRHMKPAMSRGHNLARGHLSSGLTTAEHVSHILSPAERLVSQEDEEQGVSEEEAEGAEKTEETEMVEVASDGHLYVTTVQLRGGYACVYQGGGVTVPALMVLATASYSQKKLGHASATVTVYIWDQRLAIKDFKAEILGGRRECVVHQTRLRLMNILTGSSLHCRLEIVGSSIERWQHCRRHDDTLGLPVHQNLNLDELMVNLDMTGSYWSSATSPFTFSWLLETQSPQPNPPLHPGPWPFHCVVDISHVTKNASPQWFDMVGSEVVTRLGITLPCGDVERDTTPVTPASSGTVRPCDLHHVT